MLLYARPVDSIHIPRSDGAIQEPIGLYPSSHIFKVTYQGEEQPTIAFIRKLAHRIPVVALEETANNVKRARQLADETQVERHLQISCVKKINCNERNG